MTSAAKIYLTSGRLNHPGQIKSGELAASSKWAITQTANPFSSSSDTDGGAKLGVKNPVPRLLFLSGITAKSNQRNSIQTR